MPTGCAVRHRLHRPRRTRVRSRPLRSGPDAPRQLHRWARRRRAFGNAALRAARLGLAGVGHPQRALGQLADVISGRDNAFNGMANQRVDQVSERRLRRQDAEQLSESGRVRAAGAGHVRQPRAQQHQGARLLEGRSGRCRVSYRIGGDPEYRAARWRRSICSTRSTGATPNTNFGCGHASAASRR